ncbi:MAG TPA: type I DNA topoisomerase [Bacilli bacterium]|nr:type I DNA topoisomerase [Bacilli bacterium]
MKSLVIVESPTKRKTIGKYLKDLEGDFEVEASIGHIRDLATSGKDGLGVDTENGFKPRYVISKSKTQVVETLKKAVKKSGEVILATDPDREGEAIAWHLAEVLGLDVNTTKRIEFHEITRDSILSAMANPRTIDIDMKASQETRRIFDRISGFKLSKLLQKKIKSRSAGRVQSVSLKMIVDREREIEAFVPEEYWTLQVDIKADDKHIALSLSKVDGKKPELSNGQQADELLARLGERIQLIDIKKTTKKRESKPPFKTSTLQQEAANKFKFDTSRTSRVAHQLYEGVQIGDELVGLITYIRTDSVRLSESYINRARNFIKETYGEKYIGSGHKVKSGLLAQDAHEAIRPTGNHRTPESIRSYLSPDQFKLYQLIYNRTLASLMPDKIDEVITYTFADNGVTFTTDSVATVFDGFTRVYFDKEEDESKKLPPLALNEFYRYATKNSKQNFTNPPPRLSEAKLVEEMEKNGIGRPSTYASTIATLKKRDYVTAKSGVLTPTQQGKCTVQYLELYFKDFINPTFTANMEKQLDEVQDGNNSAVEILSSFYDGLLNSIGQAGELPNLAACQKDVGECPLCHQGRLIEKKGRFGAFIACSRFPECKYIHKQPKPEAIRLGRPCPKCGKELLIRYSDKRKSYFIACSSFPKCKYTEPLSEELQQKYVKK